MERSDDTVEPSLWALWQRSRTDRVLRREGDVMGLTTAIALIVALTAGNDHAPHTKFDVLAIVWGTTIGLALAHSFALIVSARLVHDSENRYSWFDVLVSQLTMATIVAASATAVVAVLSTELDRLGARVTAGVFIGALVGVESRAGGSSKLRAAALGIGASALAIAIAVAKWSLSK